MKPSDDRLPVTVLSGFLGSGKTTLMNHLLAADLFRSKGIIAIREVPERMVFQGVHGMFRITLGQLWAKERRLTQAVFIGRNLQRDEILAGVNSCHA